MPSLKLHLIKGALPKLPCSRFQLLIPQTDAFLFKTEVKASKQQTLQQGDKKGTKFPFRLPITTVDRTITKNLASRLNLLSIHYTFH